MAYYLGIDTALAISTAHEVGTPNNPPGEEKQDLHNNAVGALLGASQLNPFLSWQDIENIVWNSLFDGSFMLFPAGTPTAYGGTH